MSNINDFFGQGQSRSRDVSQRKMMNMYITKMDGIDVALGTPCTKLKVDLSQTIPKGNPRGLHYCSSLNRLFGVFGNSLVEIFKDNTFVVRHEISMGVSQVTFVDDGKFMVFVDGFSMFFYDLDANSVTAPIESQIDFTNPTKIVYANGRAVVINNDPSYDTQNPTTRKSNRYYWSELRKVTEWNPLNFSTAESSPDPIKGIDVVDNNLVLFGETSYEYHRHTVDPDAPWTYVSGSNSDIGVLNPNTIASNETAIFFLGTSSQGLGKVYMIDGSNIQNIASPDLSAFININKDKIQSSFAFVYSSEQHTFYVLTFIELDRTFVYDTLNQQWHERSTRDELLNVHHYWRARYSQYAFQNIYVADSDKPFIYTLDNDKYQDDVGTKTIPCVRIAQGRKIYDNQNNLEMFIQTFELVMETGNTPILGGIEPQIMLSLSKDGGYSWGDEYWKGIGVQGDYRKRVQWRRLGRFRELDIRLEFSENARLCIKDVLISTQIQKNHL